MSDKAERMSRRAGRRFTLPSPVPRMVTWEVTHRCSIRCLHCPSESGPEVSTEGDLSTEEALEVIDAFARAGVSVLNLAGGDPLLRPDWRRLVERAVERGLAVVVTTNGSRLTPEVADDLRRLDVMCVTLPFDSHSPQLHDHLRQHPGLFEQACAAARLLTERGMRVVVNFTPNRVNWRDARGVVELALELGASGVNLSPYEPLGRAPLSLAPEPAAERRVEGRWRELESEFRGRIDLTLGEDPPRFEPRGSASPPPEP